MPATRKRTLKYLLLGLTTAVLITLACMLLLALALNFLRIGDRLLMLLNQAVKALAIVMGVRAAVPRGGERGLLSGVLIALSYMALGYALYVYLGGGSFSATGMLGEMLLGSAVGAFTGALRANLRPRERRPRRAPQA